MISKSERYFKEYLHKISDEQLLQFYNDVEWTPFPVLVIREYQNRFKHKAKKDLLTKLRTKSNLAKTKSHEVKHKLKAKTKTIKQKTPILSSSNKTLDLLEKLADLMEKEIITNKEFRDKKKKLLQRI